MIVIIVLYVNIIDTEKGTYVTFRLCSNRLCFNFSFIFCIKNSIFHFFFCCL